MMVKKPLIYYNDIELMNFPLIFRGGNMENKNLRKINLDWQYKVHVIEFAHLDPYYMEVKSFDIPNNSITVIKLVDKYLLIVSNDDGDFVETFEEFEELNETLKREFGLELNEPETNRGDGA